MPNLISLGFDKFKKVYVIPSQLTLHRSQAQLGPPSKVQRHRAHPLNREQVRPPPKRRTQPTSRPSTPTAPQQQQSRQQPKQQRASRAARQWYVAWCLTQNPKGKRTQPTSKQQQTRQHEQHPTTEQAEQPASGTWHGVSRKTPRARGPPAHAAHQQAAADQATRTAPNNSEQAQQPASGTWHGVSRSPPWHVVHQRTQPTSEQEETRQHEQHPNNTHHSGPPVVRGMVSHAVPQSTWSTSARSPPAGSSRAGNSAQKQAQPAFSPRLLHRQATPFRASFFGAQLRILSTNDTSTFSNNKVTLCPLQAAKHIPEICTRESNYGASVLLKLLKWLEGLSTWKTGLAHAFSVRVLLMHTVEALSQVAVRIIAISECSERH